MHASPPDPAFLESLHVRLAYQLVAEESGLCQRLMRQLVAHPRPFAELAPLGLGRHAGEITDALRQLERYGLIERRTSQRQVPVVHTYKLTTLGAQAEGTMQRLRPVQDIPRNLPRRQKSGLGNARTGDPRWMLQAK